MTEREDLGYSSCHCFNLDISRWCRGCVSGTRKVEASHEP